MKKTDVARSYHQGSHGRPMLNVKHYGQFGQAQAVRDRFQCSEAVADKALEYAWDRARDLFWEHAKDDAVNIFGNHAKVYSEGRQGGWLVVNGLPDVEEWDAIQLGKWAQFARYMREDMAGLAELENILDAIEANRWAEEGAELYNFSSTPGGRPLCMADLNRVQKEAADAAKLALIASIDEEDTP